jgi:cysteine desulfurase
MTPLSRQRISFDANAGVPLSRRALEKFIEVTTDTAANPSSIHQDGRAAQAVIEKAKREIAKLFSCSPSELFFTSGATEANNLAISGLIGDLEQRFDSKPILISSKAEHPSCLAYLRMLQQRGYKLHLLDVDRYARFDLGEYVFDKNSCYLIVGQWANNETGSIQDIAACANAVADNVRWHCDAVQGFGKIEFDERLLDSDSFSLSGHKFGAPKGCGLLRIKDPASCLPIFYGGGQQDSVRPGTESPALSASLCIALSDAMQAQAEVALVQKGRIKILRRLLGQQPFEYQLNTPEENCLPNTLNISFLGIDGRMLLPALDIESFSLSSGSACASGAALASGVLVAAGVSNKLAQASIRLSFMSEYPNQNVEQRLAEMLETVQRLYKVAKH